MSITEQQRQNVVFLLNSFRNTTGRKNLLFRVVLRKSHNPLTLPLVHCLPLLMQILTFTKSVLHAQQSNQQSPVEPKDLCTETDNDAIRIQAARASRLLPEPDFTTNTDAVVVAVRHIDLGVITRCFRSSETITAVYDWVGSLQAEPVNFVLCNALSPGHGIDPSSSVCTVAKTMLTMSKEQNCPYLIQNEPEISMEGFGHINCFGVEEIALFHLYRYLMMI